MPTNFRFRFHTKLKLVSVTLSVIFPSCFETESGNMADKRRAKLRKNEEDSKPTKEEYAVAKYLRFGLPVREGRMHGMDVKCFIASAAVDKLLESKWSASKCKKDPLFTNRASVVNYLEVLLIKGLFHRAERDRSKKDKEKLKKKKREKEGKKEKEEASPDEELRERKGKKDKKAKKGKSGETDTDKNGDETDKKDTSEKKPEKKDEKKKKERKLKLLMPDDQWFGDGDEVYVWIYDPVNAKNFLIGLLMVLGAIGLCMFPLWPEEVRIGVSYISQALGAFMALILSLCVVRLILFCVIWILTLGRHHFWLFPNLMEDVGFFDSFKPLYKHDVVTNTKESGAEKKKSKKKTTEEEEKPAIENSETNEKSSDKDDSDEFEVIKKEDIEETNGQGVENEANDENEGDTENGAEDEFDDEEDEEEDDDDDEDLHSEKDDNKQKSSKKKTN